MSEPLKISASAIETADPKHDGCFRKWYFQHVKRLPQLPQGSTTFGTVLHAVCERYLLADANGNLKGKPVDLYPKGWEQPLDRNGKKEANPISLEEQALIKSLIEKAIAEGILMRVPGREIEKEFDGWEITEDVIAKGFIDLLEPGAIRDHKTTKDMKWAKSINPEASEYLGDNIQMMFYSYWYYTQGGYAKDKPLTLSHQYYCKNPSKPHVEKREVTTTWERVDRFMRERIAPVIEMMLVYRDVEKFSDIPLPECPESACKKYGGCPFARICTNLETVDGYTERINKELTGVNSTDYRKIAQGLSNKKGEETMSEESPMQKKIRLMREKQTGMVPAPEAPEAVKEEPKAPAPAATPAPSADKQAAPWHFAGCKACAGNDILGLNSQGTACRICDIMCKKTGVKTSADFKWKVEAGKLVVMDGEQVVVESKTNEAPTAKEQVADAPVVETVDESAHKTTLNEEPVSKEEEKKAVLNEVVEQAAHKKDGKWYFEEPAPIPFPSSDEPAPFSNCEIASERDKFTIMINCAVVESKVKGGGSFGSPACRITAEELMIVVNTEMSRIMGAAEWDRMNAFDKRDAVQRMAKPIADALGSSTLVVTRLPKASLLEAVVMGVRPYAKEVIQAVTE